MKFITILFAIVFAASAEEREIYKLPQEIIDKIYKFATPCAKENNVDVAMIPRLADGTLPRDDAHNKFLYCFTTTIGYVSEDGHIVVDKLVTVLKDHPLQEKFKNALLKCNEVTKENPIATVVEMNTCFAERTPIRVRLE